MWRATPILKSDGDVNPLRMPFPCASLQRELLEGTLMVNPAFLRYRV